MSFKRKVTLKPKNSLPSKPKPLSSFVKKKPQKKIFGTISNYQFNVRTQFFTKILLPKNKKHYKLSKVRTFLVDTPMLFFKNSIPGYQSLLRLLYLRFTAVLGLLASKPTFNPINIFSYWETIRTLHKFTRSYLVYFFKPVTEYFYLSRNFRYKSLTILYFLNFRFRRNRLFINIYNSLNRNYLSLTLGLFLSFLKKKKAFKKNILLKLLTMRFLRKMFISLRFYGLRLRINGIPLELTKLLSTLNKPIIHIFTDPLSERLVDEKSPEFTTYLANNPPFTTPYMYFINSKSYTFLKTKKRGRVKRKIRRRLVKLNNLTD